VSFALVVSSVLAAALGVVAEAVAVAVVVVA
jgi:hypothetical protein